MTDIQTILDGLGIQEALDQAIFLIEQCQWPEKVEEESALYRKGSFPQGQFSHYTVNAIMPCQSALNRYERNPDMKALATAFSDADRHMDKAVETAKKILPFFLGNEAKKDQIIASFAHLEGFQVRLRDAAVALGEQTSQVGDGANALIKKDGSSMGKQ